MADHTPGPWHVGTGNGEGSIFAEKGRMKLEEGKTTLYPIATTPIHGDDYTTQDRANARLIAASPALLEALEAVAKLLDQGQPVDPEHDGAWIREAITQAREVPAHA